MVGILSTYQSTASNSLKKCQESGSFKDKIHTGRLRKITKRVRRMITKQLISDSATPIRNIRKDLKNACPDIRIGEKTIRNFCNDNDLILYKP